jgi:glycosyltransferase involved in cell wall biosynthesis
MKNNLSLVVIAYNNEKVIEKALLSVQGLASEIILVDNYSTDSTVKIAQKYRAKVIYYRGKNRGVQCQLGIDHAKNDWILVLDSDEAISKELKTEICQVLNSKDLKDGYYIPFQSYYLGRKLNYGGENYKKLILFNRKKGRMKFFPIHYVWQVATNRVGYLKNKVDHYSYQDLVSLYKKFTLYALEEAKLKIKNHEKTSLKKILLYPPHMFWARFIKDKGYKDGFLRIPLDLGFAYMEFLTYLAMLFMKKPNNSL